MLDRADRSERKLSGAMGYHLKDLSVWRLRIDSAQGAARFEVGLNREALLHVLVGEARLGVEGSFGRRTISHLGERRDVFSGLPAAVTFQPGTRAYVTAVSRYLDALWVEAKLTEERGNGLPSIVRPQDVQVHDIGEGHYRREVREVVGGHGITDRLRIGETISGPGLWSSWPHHDFDAQRELAGQFEEVFLYFTKPASGWGIQCRDGIYCTGEKVSDVRIVRNGDYGIMPLGNHPIIAGVDNWLAYVWVYLSPIPKNYAKWAEDVGGYA